MLGILLYCRPGFENDCANEVQAHASELEVFGYIKTVKNSGYVVYHCYDPNQVEQLAEKLDYKALIFARQMIVAVASLEDLDAQDRVSPVLKVTEQLAMAGDIFVECPEGDNTKQLLSFCRKFTVPLRQKLRQKNHLTKKEHNKKNRLHVCFLDYQTAYVGYSIANNRSEAYMGINRLRFPNEAPSRSTLKLDEAFQTFLTKKEQEERAHSGLRAVDLGACPGGWTYQLVRRGMFVSCVDNGLMADSLMETGQITHYQEDGFKFEPARKNIHWLVCDMIEKPKRVAKLMAQWLIDGWAKEAIFNLKLPMKQRYQEAMEDLQLIHEMLEEAGYSYQLQAKHLYHDREEITVHLRLTNKVYGTL